MGATAFGGETAESYYDEGLTAGMKGDLMRSAECFERAIRLDSTMATAYQQLGKCYARLGKHARAVELLSQVVKKRPELMAAHLDLGSALNGLGKLPEARAQYNAVLAAESDNAKAMLGLAQSDFFEGKWESAMKFAESAQFSGGSNFAVLYMLGRASKLAGKAELSVKTLQRADKLLEKSIESNSDKPEGHFLRGEVAFVRESFLGGLQHYRDAEERAEPGRTYLAYGENFSLEDILGKQGLCLLRLGKSDRARELGARIEELNPEHTLGKSLRES